MHSATKFTQSRALKLKNSSLKFGVLRFIFVEHNSFINDQLQYAV